MLVIAIVPAKYWFLLRSSSLFSAQNTKLSLNLQCGVLGMESFWYLRIFWWKCDNFILYVFGTRKTWYNRTFRVTGSLMIEIIKRIKACYLQNSAVIQYHKRKKGCILVSTLLVVKRSWKLGIIWTDSWKPRAMCHTQLDSWLIIFVMYSTRIVHPRRRLPFFLEESNKEMPLVDT